MRHRKGFTLVEVMVVGGLMAFLSLLLASTWATMGSPTADLIRRGQCMQEINMAVAALARDLGGYQPDGRGRGEKSQGRFTDWHSDGTALTISFNGEGSVHYYVENARLIRENVDTGAKFTVAKNVSGILVTDYTEYMEIVLVFRYPLHPLKGQDRYLTRRCTLKIKMPSA
jgi:type II secretory pathway pseudopilin PulG